MFNRKDPLVDSVKQVMDENRVRRDVERLVNEAFGVTSRKGLPHELHAEYDTALAEATETALKEGMSKLLEDKKNWPYKPKYPVTDDEPPTTGKYRSRHWKSVKEKKEKEKEEAPKTTRMNESFEQFLRNKFSKE
jgi:hypothetical protein